MRTRFGIGTPRGLQGRLAALFAVAIGLWTAIDECWHLLAPPRADHEPAFTPHHRPELLPVSGLKQCL